MRCFALLLLACLALPLGAAAQSPAVVADGRSDGAEPDLTGWDTHAAVEQARVAARAHWQPQDHSYEEDFGVFGLARGAFTEAGASQHAVLYLMSLWPWCCPKMGIAVLEGDRLVYNATFEGTAQQLSKVPDLDGDGRDELALLGFYGMGGQQCGSVTLVGFGHEGFAAHGTEATYEGACAGLRDGEMATRVLALPGPVFQVETYTRATCDSETWEASGPAETRALGPPGLTFVALPVQ